MTHVATHHRGIAVTVIDFETGDRYPVDIEHQGVAAMIGDIGVADLDGGRIGKSLADKTDVLECSEQGQLSRGLSLHIIQETGHEGFDQGYIDLIGIEIEPQRIAADVHPAVSVGGKILLIQDGGAYSYGFRSIVPGSFLIGIAQYRVVVAEITHLETLGPGHRMLAEQ